MRSSGVSADVLGHLVRRLELLLESHLRSKHKLLITVQRPGEAGKRIKPWVCGSSPETLDTQCKHSMLAYHSEWPSPLITFANLDVYLKRFLLLLVEESSTQLTELGSICLKFSTVNC